MKGYHNGYYEDEDMPACGYCGIILIGLIIALFIWLMNL
jgi:hypothetical protein